MADIISLLVRELIVVVIFEAVVEFLGQCVRMLQFFILGKPRSFKQLSAKSEDEYLNRVYGYICLTTLGIMIALW
ncbi:MAG: hypothetical protein RL660_2366 [Bacteroidota bacterium]|jgi:hypothetical protein